MADFYGGLHPDDRERVAAAFAAATDPARRALYDVEYRTVGKEDGVVRWVAAKGRASSTTHGDCVRVIGTALDITERRAMQESLRQSEERLRKADRKKDEFLAMLAHELRNPLAPIGNAAALLQHPALQPEAGGAVRGHDRAAEQGDGRPARRPARGLAHQHRQARAQEEDRRPASIVESALEPVRPALETKRHAFRVELNGGEVPLDVDPIRMAQVLTNLLTNAIKYSDPGGAIVLRAQAGAEEVTFEVEDTGIGLSTAQIPTIFDMFAQVSSGMARSEGGLGIGLAVAKALIEMHGGRISATSPGLGMGSCFTVVVPRGAPRAADPAPLDDVASAPAMMAREPILIADDNVDAAESLAAVLELEGYTVHLAHDGVQALQVAARVKPVACFLDIGMPGLDGYEVARRLRAMSQPSPMLLVATTGWGKSEDRRHAEEAGFDLHMTKPIDVTQAIQVLADRDVERAPA